ncbi:MAG: hypothetical protein AB8E82_20260 [Aureispira sp.]
MSLQQKSEKSIQAAEVLLEQQFYCSSIHCYYYACFQMLCNKLFQHYNSNQLESIRRDHTMRPGLHVRYLTQFTRDLRQHTVDQSISVDFQTKMQYLKKLRTKADYKPEATSYQQNIKAQQLATDCLDIIHTTNLY